MNKKICTALLAASSLMAGAASAATTTSTLDVTAFVGSACAVSVSPITFNVIDPAGPVETWATGSIAVTCNPGVPFNIALDAGQNFDGVDRRVNDGLGNYGAYWLGNPDVGQPWGDDFLTHPDSSVDWVATGGNDVLTVDGVFFQSQVIPDGIYSDVVTVTVTY